MCLYFNHLVVNCVKNSSEDAENNRFHFFMLGVSFKCLAVGFTSMLYRSEAKQLFEIFLHYHLSVLQKLTLIH